MAECRPWEVQIGPMCALKYGTIPEKYDRVYVAQAMIDDGGSFVHNLGKALMQADLINTTKIKVVFPEYWERYGSTSLERHKKKVAGYF